MIVPGSNLLSIALGVIGSQSIQLTRFVSRVQNARGDWVNTYAAAVPVEGSWQPVDARSYQALGLDVKKRYFNFYAQEPIAIVARDAAPDVAARNGRRYETVGDTPWRDVDGWAAAMFVDVGADV